MRFKRYVSSLAGLALLFGLLVSPAFALPEAEELFSPLTEQLSVELEAAAEPAAQRQTALSGQALAELEAAEAAGKAEVTLLIAASDGKMNQVLSSLSNLGAKVEFTDAEFGYIRTKVSTQKAAAVGALTNLIDGIDVDELIPIEIPTVEGTAQALAVAPPSEQTPAVNPYLPAGDTGSPQFRAANPTYDGRGVVIGIVDTGVDLANPYLQTAKDLQGNEVRKVIDWVTGTNPLTDNDPTWVKMSTQVVASGGTFTQGGVTYTAPAPGTYQFGVLNERDARFNAEVGNDINRDGNPRGSKGTFAVLWNLATNDVYVDTNQDDSFADELAMTDYKIRYDVGFFGTDDPATAVEERMAFVVQTDRKNLYVNIGLVSDAHGSHVAGIAAGKGYFNGAFDGQAPEAQVMSVQACLYAINTGCTAHALVEGMIYVAKNGADVINMSIGGLPALNDGNNARAILYNRLIDRYQVQLFISAGNNGPGLNTAGDPAVADRVISVGATVTADTFYYNYGNIANRQNNIFPFSAKGPRADGFTKPNLTAPGSAIAAFPMWQEGFQGAGIYDLPPGYGMIQGTSMASPQAAGAAALLLSAAKQNNLKVTPENLRLSLTSTADFFADYQAHEQGAGLIQVAPAWGLLQKRPSSAGISSTAPVNHVLSGMLATPHQGHGIYEREGWFAGMSGERTVTLKRVPVGKAATLVTYNVTMLGNDGTFSAPSQIRLPVVAPVKVPITINARTPGVHSVLMQLDDPATPGVDYQMLHTIVVAEEPFSDDNGYAVTVSGTADRPGYKSFFFAIPEETEAISFDLNNLDGRSRFFTLYPYGVPIGDPTAYETAPVGSSVTVTKPMPGVWEVAVEVSRASEAEPATFEVTASVKGISIDPSEVNIEDAVPGQAYSETFIFTNTGGPFTGRAVGSNIGTASSERAFTFEGNELMQWGYNLGSGFSEIRARIGNASDARADLDLYLFYCGLTGSSCQQVRVIGNSGSEEELVYPNPIAGIWIFVVDTYSVPAGTTEFDYSDVLTHPSFGSVQVSDADAHRPRGASWSVDASMTAPGFQADRFWQGFVHVVSGSTVYASAPFRLFFGPTALELMEALLIETEEPEEEPEDPSGEEPNDGDDNDPDDQGEPGDSEEPGGSDGSGDGDQDEPEDPSAEE